MTSDCIERMNFPSPRHDGFCSLRLQNHDMSALSQGRGKYGNDIPLSQGRGEYGNDIPPSQGRGKYGNDIPPSQGRGKYGNDIPPSQGRGKYGNYRGIAAKQQCPIARGEGNILK